jgi:oxaloacetate decarboxylase beta subunit
MEAILHNLSGITWQMLGMWALGAALIYLAIKKDMEPTLLLPMGFGAILVNLPNSGAIEVLQTLFNAVFQTNFSRFCSLSALAR